MTGTLSQHLHCKQQELRSGWFSLRPRDSTGARVSLSGPVLEWKEGWSLLHLEQLRVLCPLRTRLGQCPEQAQVAELGSATKPRERGGNQSTLQLLPLQIQCLECCSLLLFTSLVSRMRQGRALAESQLPQQTRAFWKRSFLTVQRGEDRDTGGHKPRGFLLSEDKLPHPFPEPPQKSCELKVLLALPAG